MGSGRPTHGAMIGHPKLNEPWWACHVDNHSSSPITNKRLVRHMSLSFGAVYGRGDDNGVAGITYTHRGIGLNLAKMEVNGSAMIAMGGYFTNILIHGTVAVGDMMRMSTLYGVLRQEDTTVRTGHVMAFSMGASTDATHHARINVLVLPWRI